MISNLVQTKQIIKILKLIGVTACILMILSFSAMAQKAEETIQKELSFSNDAQNPVFFLANINGHIEVEGYDGATIQLEAKKQISAKTEARLQKGKEEISVGVMELTDSIVVFIDGPCGGLTRNNYSKNKRKHQGWGYNWNNCRFDYDFVVDFNIKVPKNVNLRLSTINRGDINVDNTHGNLVLNNINGSISLNKVSGQTDVHTINGDVDITYTKNPEVESKYYTLNGDINAHYQKGLAADITFKTFNGDFFTNLSDLKQQTLIEKKEHSRGNGISYKIDGRSLMRARNGGVRLNFETFNGDVYVKEN
ncbi:DUF4097 family beta strand repeat-containing protein [Fulvivirgaceae bacterium BMA10]|uniref:DUF4097 family beta strand repeat-containing protein n=1 Tax=Splendidivirga corallicola TaxID=3051826 RepID=A0ABT8KS36_9BACT|nr:DUF4097 family beta strand repeat-containing protein [Fulvivirgaceae bacterium BMA10]